MICLLEIQMMIGVGGRSLMFLLYVSFCGFVIDM